MKKLFLFPCLVIGSFSTNGQTIKKESSCNLGVSINHSYSKAHVLDSILKYYTTHVMPGASIAIYTEKEGWWASSGGYANVEKKIAMEDCHLQYLQSVSKTYMAVEILQLQEEGKIDVNAIITKYLPVTYSRYIKNAEQITVRMLLNHTSGIAEYNENAQFISQVIEHPLRNFSRLECLKSIVNDKPFFAPGSKYRYTNTNYLLLSLIGDAITGDHATYIKRKIFSPLGLKNSYYGNNYTYLKGLHLPQSYWDVFNMGVPVNVTNFQQMTVACSKGDDGIVCTTTDAIKFLKGLMDGKLLKPESMTQMMDFVKDENGNKRYGMGLIYFDMNGIIAYGHGGGGIGAGCGLMYVPSLKTYLFFATNLGVFVESELVKKTGDFRDALLATVLK